MPHRPSQPVPRPARRWSAPSERACLAVVLGVLLASVPALAATASPAHHRGDRAPELGSHALVFDPSMPTSQIQAAVDAISDQQTDDEMGTNRYSLLFKPGVYGTDEEPLQIKVGYYTEVAGLGAAPGDVTVNGKIEVYNRCLRDGGTSYCVALNNFWRSLSNLTLKVNGTGQDGCRTSANFWAVSQASSVRRVDVQGGTFSLMDYCSDGPQYASGGYLADSRAGTLVNGSQQQWLTRNSEVGSWSNGVWNQVFSGVVGAPAEDGFPTEPYTTLRDTPVSREKPYLFVDDRGGYNVRVPSAHTDTRGVSWADGTTPGRTVPIGDFFVAHPGDSVQRINAQLARGRNLLLTPGVYDVDRSIAVKRAGTVVLGMGQATLTAVDGAVPVTVADRPGIVIAGVTVDAGTRASPALMQLGGRERHHGDRRHDRRHDRGDDRARGADRRSGQDNPATLSDVYFRVGGPHVGKARVALKVDSDDVLIDHTWVWRADHGVEGFTGPNEGDTQRWNTNTARNGVIVNGDDVTATGLFVEHFQQHNTIWNGERGRVVLYQNELPYDPPAQQDWTQRDGTLGYAGYKVGDRVRDNRLWGGGSYVFNRNDPSIVTEHGFEVPRTPGVRLHHVLTVNLDAGTIRHVVNDVGEQVDATRSGRPSYVSDYPAR